MRTAAEEAEATFKDSAQGMPAAVKAQTERWRQTAQRYESEPETGEGRKELMSRAKVKEEHRTKSLAALPHVRIRLGGLQLAIVLAGAAALTTVMWLTFISMGLGVVGAAFTILAFVAPTLILSSAKKTPGSAGLPGRRSNSGERSFSGAGRPWPA